MRREQGFTFLAALIAVVLVGASLVGFAEAWSRTQQRDREIQLLWVGEQFRNAIGLYYQRTPGSVKKYPEKLEDLLEDKRYLSVQRYLRRLYVDPMTGKAEWGLVSAPDGGIAGVYSLSEETPLRTERIRRNVLIDRGATAYRQWHFVYEPTLTELRPTAGPRPASRTTSQ